MKKTFRIEKKLLLIPVIFGGETKNFSFHVGGETVMEFTVPVDPVRRVPEDSRDFYGALPVGAHMGEDMTVEAEVPEDFFDAILEADEPKDPGCSRPVIHFTPLTGWMNDPNGLVFDGKKYLLYFQHNPTGKPWGNMTWGHAESEDLLHWTQLDEALLPDELGTMFSGSGMVDERNALGFGGDAIAFFYTAAGNNGVWSEGKPFVQCLAHSTDGGRTLVKDGVIIENLGDGNRDPKVYRHEKSGHYYLVLFVQDPHEFAIFVSDDLKNWRETQRLSLPGLRECPDLRRIPVENDPDAEKYVFSAADGTYVTGSFDGSCFTPESGVNCMFGTRVPYAAQTFSGPDDVILLPWLRTGDSGKPYTSAMGVPRVLTLRSEPDGLRVAADPDPILAELASEETELELVPEQGEGGREQTVSAEFEQDEESAFELILRTPEERLCSFSLDLRGTRVEYREEEDLLTVTGVYTDPGSIPEMETKKEKAAFDPEEPEVRRIRGLGALTRADLLIDGNILEITLNGGLENWIFPLLKEEPAGTETLEADGRVAVTARTFLKE